MKSVICCQKFIHASRRSDRGWSPLLRDVGMGSRHATSWGDAVRRERGLAACAGPHGAARMGNGKRSLVSSEGVCGTGGRVEARARSESYRFSGSTPGRIPRSILSRSMFLTETGEGVFSLDATSRSRHHAASRILATVPAR